MPLKADTLFEQMTPYLVERGAEFVKKLNAIYQFHVYEKKGGPITIFTVDLKNGNGSAVKGDTAKPDAIFIMSDENTVKLAKGELNPQIAFLQGKMKIKGNMAAATKFTPDLLPKIEGL